MEKQEQEQVQSSAQTSRRLPAKPPISPAKNGSSAAASSVSLLSLQEGDQGVIKKQAEVMAKLKEFNKLLLEEKEAAGKEIEELKEEIEGLGMLLIDLKGKNILLQEKLEMLSEKEAAQRIIYDRQIGEMEASKEQLQEALESESVLRKRLEDELGGLKNENEKLQESARGLVDKNKELQSGIALASANYNRQKQETDSLRGQKEDEAERKIAELRRINQQLTIAGKVLADKNKAVSADLQAMRDGQADIEDFKRQEQEKSGKAREALSREQAANSEERDNFLKEIARLREENDRSQIAMFKMKEEMTKEHSNDVQRREKDANEIIARRRGELEKAQKTIELLQEREREQYKAVSAELQVMRDGQADIAMERDNFLKEIVRLREENDRSQRAMFKMKEEIMEEHGRDTQRIMEDANEIIARRRGELEKAQKTIELLQEREREQLRKSRSDSQRIAELTRENEHLRAELRARDEIVAKQGGEYDALKKQLDATEKMIKETGRKASAQEVKDGLNKIYKEVLENVKDERNLVSIVATTFYTKKNLHEKDYEKERDAILGIQKIEEGAEINFEKITSYISILRNEFDKINGESSEERGRLLEILGKFQKINDLIKESFEFNCEEFYRLQDCLVGDLKGVKSPKYSMVNISGIETIVTQPSGLAVFDKAKGSLFSKTISSSGAAGYSHNDGARGYGMPHDEEEFYVSPRDSSAKGFSSRGSAEAFSEEEDFIFPSNPLNRASGQALQRSEQQRKK